MKPPTDTFTQTTRRLASEVQRLRDWAGGDPARQDRVAEAMVQVTAHRLSGHAWAEAASDAQQAVTLSARVLAAHGPVGPYTPRPDAVRSITSLVHLALIQSAAGLQPQAQQVLAAAFGLREQLRRLDLDAALAPRTVAWALLVRTRAELAAGEVAAANAWVDAAVAAGADDGEFLLVDLDRAASDARWAAGLPGPSVEYALRAVERYEGFALELLARPAQLPPAMLERLSEPLFGLYSEAADRMPGVGAPGLGLRLRRRLVDLLGAIAVARPAVQPLLVSALSDLADDLRAQERGVEADDVAALASSIAGEADADGLPRRERARLGDRTSWESLPSDEAFGVAPQPEPSGRLSAQRGTADAAEKERRVTAEAELASRAERDATQAARLAQEAERRRVEAERRAVEEAERERREAAEAAERERLERQRKRAERIAEHEREAERERAEAEAALRARVSDETPEERAEREELERLVAELAELEAADETPRVESQPEVEAASLVERVETPAPEPDPQPPVEPEREAAPLVELVETPELEPAPEPPVEPEPEVAAPLEPAEPLVELVETPAPEPDPQVEPEREAPSLVELVETPEPAPAVESTPESDALSQARAVVEEAAASGKRKDVRAANEALVDELRGRYEADPEHYVAEFLEALDQLATARWQAGDWWGSRGPSKEAKALRKRHGL